MTTFVTGAAGFIGYHACRKLLANGEKVIGLDNLNDYYSVRLKQERIAELNAVHRSGFKFLQADLADQASLKSLLADLRFERILHLGAQAGVRYSIENPSVYIQSNLVGHANILEIARDRQVGHLVYASSSSVYGGNQKLPFSVEDRADLPVSLYAATKRSNELLSQSYAYLYNLPQTGLRFFTVYGPWGRPDMAIWRFTEAILAEKTIKVFGEGRMRRDFTYIDDVISGVLASLNSPPPVGVQRPASASQAPHRIYNIGNSRSEDLERMIECVERACGKQARKELVPMQPGDVRDTYADIGAIQRDLGFMPKTSIDEGIPAFVSWYRGHYGV